MTRGKALALGFGIALLGAGVIDLLEHEERLQWEQTREGLAVRLPAESPGQSALALRISFGAGR